MELLGRYSKWTYWRKNAERIFRYTMGGTANPAKAAPGHVRKLPAADVARLVEAYQAGATVYELAAAFKVHRTTVSLHLERTGVAMRRQGMRSEQIRTAAALYQQGWSLMKLGEKFGVGAETVRKELRLAGVAMRRPWERG